MPLESAPLHDRVEDAARRSSRTSILFHPAVVAVVLAALITGYIGADLYRDRRNLIEDARNEVETYTRLLAEAVDHTLGTADIALARIVDFVGPDVDWSAFDPRAARLAAERYLREFQAPIDLVLYDEGGTARFSYRRDVGQMANFADRPFFLEHAGNPDPRTAYGVPFAGPTTGTTIIPISRRLSRADGSFAGIAVAGSIDVMLEGLHRSLELGANVRATLLRGDGIMLWRHPSLPAAIGRSFAGTAMFAPERIGTRSGTAIERGRLTPGDILYAYRWIPDRQLVVTVGVEMAHVLAPWWRSAVNHAIGLVIVYLAIAGVTLRQIQVDLRLRRSHERLRSILTTMTEGLMVIRADGSVADANPAAVAILDMPMDRLLRTNLNRDPLRLVDADGRPVGLERSGTRAAPRTGETLGEGTVGLLRDGAPTRWLSVNAAPIRAAGGSVEAAVVTFSDVTERREAERALTQSRQRLAEVFAVLAEGVTVRDAQGTIIDANPAAETILGRPRDMIVGTTSAPDQTLPWKPVDENGTPILNRDNPALGLYAGREPVKNRIIGIHRPDGTRRWIAVNNRPSFDAAGRITMAVSSFADVTDARNAEIALRESQQRYAATVNSLAEGVIVRDARGAIIDVNPAAIEILGRSRAELVGLGIDSLLHWQPVDENGMQLRSDEQIIARTVRTGEAVANRIIGIHRPDGTRRWLSASNQATRDARGEIALVVSSFVDITDQRRMSNVREAEHRALELAAENAPLPQILAALCLAHERDFPNVSGSILLADHDGATLHHGAAPSLPPEYCAAVDGLAVGHGQGSCGTAAFRLERVIAADIATDPLWARFRDLAARHGLAACWSTPLFGEQGRLIGTFAVYSRTPRQPTAEELAATVHLSRIAAVAIDRAKGREAQQQSEALYRSLVETIPDGVIIGQDGKVCFVNAAAAAMAGAPADALLGTELQHLVDPRDQALVQDQHARRLAGEAAAAHYSVRVRRIDGSPGPVVDLRAVRIMYRGRPAALAALTDITEQRETEAKLRQSEARFRDFARSSSDWYWEQDSDLRFTFFSADDNVHDGLVSSDYIGKTRRETSPLGVSEEQWQEHDALVAAREPFRDFRIQRIDASGTLRTLSLSGVPVFDETGAFRGYRGIGRDVTEEVAMVEALRQSREQIASTINAMAEGLIVRRPDLTIVDVNAAAAAILGTSREALIGSVRLTPDRPMFDQSGDEMEPDARPSVIAVRTGASVRGRVISLARPDGMRRWLSFNTELARRPDGSVEAIVTTFSDITDQRESERALRESEERYRRLVEFLPTALLVVDRGGRMVHANAAACRLFAAAAPGELIGRSYDDIVHPADRDEMRRLRAERGTDPAPAHGHVERRCVTLDGREMTCEIDTGWIAGEASDETMLAIHDVTARHAAERAVRDYAERLQLVTDNIPMLVSYSDVDSRIRFMSPYGAAWFGRTRDEIVGQRLDQVLEPADFALRAPMIERLRRGERVAFSGESHFPDGATRWIESISVPHVVDGAVRGYFAFARDETERHAAERAVRDLAERLQLITDNIPFLIAYVGADQRYDFVNRAGAQWLARPPESIVGRTVEEIFAAPQLYRRQQWMQRALAGETVRDTSELDFPDGRRRWIDSSLLPHVVDGRVAGYISVSVDVTEKQRAALALRKTAEQLRVITDNLPVLVAYVGSDERYRFINRHGANWYARPVEAIVGRSYAELLGPEEYERRRSIITRALGGEEIHVTQEMRYPDGSARMIESRCVPHRVDGRVVGYFAFSQDITERHAAERAAHDLAERLQLVTDHLPMLVGYVDQEERMQFINRTGAQWFGRPAAEIIGRRLGELFDSEHYANRRDMVSRALAGELVHFDGTFRHPDGTVRLTESTFVPHVVENAVRGYFGFTTDVTERVHTEEQLRQAQKMEAVGQLTGGVAHDFNNLLAIIMGNLELLADSEEKGSMPAALVERALRATRRGAELTRRLLAFSRRQTLQPERIELNALVTSLTDLLSRTLGENIRVETELADDVGTVVVDPGQLENALLNLAVNARDAMPRGGRLLIESANVELDADYVAAVKDVLPGPYVMLAVSDTGEGMTPEIVSRAFEPFFTTKEVGKGSGLGLSMVYGFVKQSGGHVAIYSEVSLGTTIRLYLPRTAVSGVASPHVKPAAAGQDGNGQHVLVVEDDPDVRQLVATQLGARGYAVQAAASGREAMVLIAGAAPIDLLLTDVVLSGGMSGADIVARARHHRPGLRVLYMSGYTEGMINMDLLRADNAHFLQKPFTRIQLAHAVREALEAGEDVS